MSLANLANRKPKTQAEAKKWAADQAWRLNNLYYIQTKEGGKKIKFQFNWAQEKFYKSIWFNNLVLKSRQYGFSTEIELIILDTCVFNENILAVVIAHDLKSAQELYRRNIQFPYDNLPESVRALAPADTRNAQTLRFPNGSGVQVATSARSGTLHILHVSEFGKICAKYPDKAREIVTGSLETVGQGQCIFIESTAEGAEGYFYDYCEEAAAKAESGKTLGMLDWKLHFFPWWQHHDYQLSTEEANATIITPEQRRYFHELEGEIGQELPIERRAWWVKKAERLGEDIYREYPSTRQEAFRMSMEGTYYGPQLSLARKQGRIMRIPIEMSVPINTFWDLGVDDFTAIWLHQRVGLENRFVGYYENTGEGLQHYANYLFEYVQRGYVFGVHHFPHDVRNRSLAHKDGKSVLDTANDLGLRPNKVIDTPDLLGGIQSVRDVFPSCWFDEERCAVGLKRLQNYRKEWSDRLAGYLNKERHDDNSHGASAFRMFAQGYTPERLSAAMHRDEKTSHAGWTRRRSNWRAS
jgi:hypothetical protein